MNIFIIVGLLINAGCIIVNRFIAEIPSKIAVPVYAVGVVCFVIGMAQMKQQGII